MRFEVIAALAIGFLLPCLETGRRGWSAWLTDFTTMFEDYVAGGLLLIAGWISVRGHAYASILLVLAWAYFAGVMGSSFWGHLEQTLRGAETEPNNTTVLAVKLALWSTCVAALVLSTLHAVRAAQRSTSTLNPP